MRSGSRKRKRDSLASSSSSSSSLDQQLVYKKKVLKEDEFVNRLTNIIRRDFYPSIMKEDVVEDRDNGVGVDEFSRRFTSEDNASFARLQAKGIEERKAKYWWANLEDDKCVNNLLLGDNRVDPRQEAMKKIQQKKLLLLKDKHNKKKRKGKMLNEETKNIVHNKTRFDEDHAVSSSSKASYCTELTHDNFLDDPTENHLPKVGGYSFVVEPQTTTAEEEKQEKIKRRKFVVQKRSKAEELGITLAREIEQNIRKKKKLEKIKPKKRKKAFSKAATTLAAKLFKKKV